MMRIGMMQIRMTQRLMHALKATLCTVFLFAGYYAFGSAIAEADPELAGKSATLQGDAGRGEALFERRCTGCHSLDENREGPGLRGTFGRVSGSLSGFGYSSALQQAQITWDEKSLEKWLTEPDSLVPGNNMEFRVPRAQERADIILFLKASAAH